MFIFTKQEQKFLLFLVLAFFVGLCTKYVRTAMEDKPDDGWRRQREEIYTEFQEKAKQVNQEKVVVHEKQHEKSQLTKKSLTGLININKASSEELQLLPRIGPATAKKILNYREANGPFQDISDIKKVKSIGPKTFEKIKEHITVE